MFLKTTLIAVLMVGYFVQAATVGLNGKVYNCEKKSSFVYHCLDGQKKILIIKNVYNFLAVTTDQKGELALEQIDKIIDGPRTIYQARRPTFGDTSVSTGHDVAETVYHNLKGVEDQLAQEFFLKAQAEKNKPARAKKDQIRLALKDSNETLQCRRGDTITALQGEKDTKCDYYACQSMVSGESILAFLPDPLQSFTAPSVLRMKNGQAKLIYDNFQALDDQLVPILDVPKKEPELWTAQESQGSSESREEVVEIDDNFFVPSKYEQSRSSFAYLSATPEDDSEPAALICKGAEVEKALALRKKIGQEMSEHLAAADIVEYLKVFNGNIHSFYVDRQKAQSLGCLYENKILDKNVLDHLDYLRKISNAAAKTSRYLDLDEVQELFKKAQSMKDIPFGYKYDGCYARAHLLARRFEAAGVPTQKVWIKGDLFVPGTDITWNYHVAPVVDVKLKSGEIKKFVIDPSLNDQAVTIDEWVASMGSRSKGPIMKTTYPFPENSAQFQRTTVALSSSDPFAPSDIKDLPEAMKMAQAEEVLREFAAAINDNRSTSNGGGETY